MQTPPTLPPSTSSSQNSFEQHTIRWFEQVVLGLNLCPFAHKPARDNTIRFIVCDTHDEVMLLDAVLDEVELLADVPAKKYETTVMIVPYLLDDFYDYQFFLSEAERKLKQRHWKGIFQLASFHPNYCFAGTDPSDLSNFTNRSPYPIIHILRQESLNAILKEGATSEEIVERNMDMMNKLSSEDRSMLFPPPLPINNKS
ncbi:MAG: hypothetical protein ACI8VC_000048 [Candidatus Endobugula sp.]|jgi:hypothetical protein